MMTNLELLTNIEKDLAWFNENFLEIQERFPNKLIAIKHKKIVASAQNSHELLRMLREKNIDEATVLIEAIPLKNEVSIL